ncbi:MAG: PQQ-dependent sugar dehydrogenase [Verrucomicrobia bacterium]|nr:PQQ-dependent sugar dehydrogenase [Verrucomicrobiota bacterium]
MNEPAKVTSGHGRTAVPGQMAGALSLRSGTIPPDVTLDPCTGDGATMTALPIAGRHWLSFALLACLSGSTLPAFAQSSPVMGRPTTTKEYRQFAMQHDGDAAQGKLLFGDEQRVACSKCYSVDGKDPRAGPDLSGVGDQFSRRDLIDAVLMPSATIAIGYSTTLVETKSGEEYQGVLKQVTDSRVELMGADGQRIRVATDDIQEQRGSSVSLMPEGLQAGLSKQELTDLIEYLVILKQPLNAFWSHRGMPDTIPQLTRPIPLRPFLNEDLRAPSTPKNAARGAQSGLVWFGQVPGFKQRFLVAHQTGIIWLLEKQSDGDATSVFADFTPETFSARGPNGLLGLAFHPQFSTNRKYYLKQQVFEDGKIATVLVERRFAPNFQKDSGEPARRLLKIVAVAEHHNGGCIEFGPDGFLYLGMGDSAPNFDPQGYAQDLRLLFGKMLRIDVDRCDPGLAYGIPDDNPFVRQPDARPEIWAYGLREPWRFSFDRVTGDLWVADLGQERGDEIGIVRRGENHGWNVYEGFELFSNRHRKEGAVYVPPIFASRRKHGSAVTGGYVYRGDKHSAFYGVYIFGDYQSRRIWGLTQDHRSLQTIRQVATSPQAITSFGTDETGGLYVVGYPGMIYQLDFTDGLFDAPVESFSARSAVAPDPEQSIANPNSP